MVSRKNATSASERFIPICRPTALSSSGVGSFALAIGSSFTLERLGGRATSSPAPSALSRPARLPRAARSCSLPTPNGRAQMPSTKPHVVIVVADDMGSSDLGCFGGEIATPTVDRLGRAGVRLSRFYNTTRCSPSRASLLTGLHPHQTGIGILTNDDRPVGYPGSLNERCVTLAEVLRHAGYATCLSGKWHLASSMWTTFDAGWDELREARLRRLIVEGLMPAGTTLSDRDPTQPAWRDVPDQAWQLTRMRAYAAQIDRMDRGIARIVAALTATGALENT